MNHIKSRLAIMNFLEFAVWGAYLTSLGQYLASHGLRDSIGWFYSIQGIVSIFMPAIVGIIADRWIQAQRMLALCHLLGGALMLAAGFYGLNAGDNPDFSTLFILYGCSVAFFMPTIGLANSVAYCALNRAGLDTIKTYPPIRTLGTVGFICAMLVTNFAGFQSQPTQLIFSGILSFCLTAYAFTLPACPTDASNKSGGLVDALGLRAFALFKNRQMAIFFIFSMLLGVALQITNGFASPYIHSFGEVPEFASCWGVHNANALISLSQMSETLCILMIPFFLKRFGIKTVMLMAMSAWVLRFAFFGVGNPGNGVIFFIASMIVYGIAFDFFNVSGSLYVDQQTDSGIRSSAQGLFMIMTNGIGATIGTLGAQAVVNNLVYSKPQGMEQITGWQDSWLIFAAYSAVVAILFALIFRTPKRPINKQDVKPSLAETESQDGGGMTLI